MGRKLLTCLCSLALLALWFAPKASAAICSLRSKTGTCLVWSAGSVTADLTLFQVGNVVNDPTYVVIDVDPYQKDGGYRFLAVCGNPGSNDHEAPGVNVIDTYLPIDATTLVDAGNVTKNGKALVSVTAQYDDATLQLLNGVCPNDNWSVVDAIPMDFSGTVVEYVYKDGACYMRSTVTDDCTITDPSTIVWDETTRHFSGSYTCAQTSGVDYTHNLQWVNSGPCLLP